MKLSRLLNKCETEILATNSTMYTSSSCESRWIELATFRFVSRNTAALNLSFPSPPPKQRGIGFHGHDMGTQPPLHKQDRQLFETMYTTWKHKKKIKHSITRLQHHNQPAGDTTYLVPRHHRSESNSRRQSTNYHNGKRSHGESHTYVISMILGHLDERTKHG